MITFLLIGAVGIFLLVISLVVGDLLDGLFDFGGDLFSGAALAGFLGAFGFGGALALDASDTLWVAVLVGLVAGLVVGAGAGYASYQLKKGGDEANVRTGDLTGMPGSVISSIPADGFGEVSVVASGHITKLNARASEPLGAGTPITIQAVLSATSVFVERRF